MRFRRLGIVGVGLMGASLALTCKRRNLVDEVIGVDVSETHRREAIERRAVDRAYESIDSIDDVDLVVLSCPIGAMIGQIPALANRLSAGALVTDMGSVKGAVVEAFEAYPGRAFQFVGSHPIAGSERNGPRFARDDLFDDKLCVVTPSARTDRSSLDTVCDFWRQLGMSVRTIAPDEHDRAFSLTSHLPHALSTALANSQVIDDKPYVGSGLAGMIRLAKSEPAVWQSIFEYNRKYVLEAFDRFDAEMRKFREALSAGDFAALENLLNDGRKISKSLGD